MKLILCFTLAIALAGLAVSQQKPDIELTPPPASAAPSAQSTLEDARKLLQAGKFDEAIARLSEFAVRYPRAKGVSRSLGIAYYGKGDIRTAIPRLQEAIAEDADDREATQLLGLSYFALGRPVDAIPLLEKVREWFPSAHLDASYYLGTAYLQAKRFNDAEAAFSDVYALSKDSAFSHLVMARMLLRNEFEPVAEEYARKAIQADPKLPLAHFLVGEIHLYKSQLPEAIAEFEAELKINPAHAPTYVRLADAYVRASKFEDAERILSRSIYLDSTSSAAYMLLGRVLLRKNDAARAAAALDRAVKLDPNNFQAHHQFGQALIALGRSSEGEAELRRAQELQNSQNRLPVEKNR